jgi:hypothetical protein
MRRRQVGYRPGGGVHTGRGDPSRKLRRSVRRSGQDGTRHHRRQLPPRTKRVPLFMRPPMAQHKRASRVLPHSGPPLGEHRWPAELISTRRHYASNVHRGDSATRLKRFARVGVETTAFARGMPAGIAARSLCIGSTEHAGRMQCVCGA